MRRPSYLEPVRRPSTENRSRYDPANYEDYRLTVNMTTYGPFATKTAALIGAKLTLLDCLGSGRDPITPAYPTPDEPVYFQIYMRDIPMSPRRLYLEIASRIDRIIEVSLSSGFTPLDNWERCRMRLSHDFPDQ